MQRTKVLFVVNNFNIGGPQKSLLSLLYKLDYEQFDVSLLSLNGKGSLTKYLPKDVQLLKTPQLLKYAILSPDKFMKNTIRLLFSRNFIFPLKAIPKILSGLLQKKIVRSKQQYWLEIKNMLPKSDEEYDVAIGVSGGHSMMYITDCVNAKNKIGWIRTDYRVLDRDYKIDAKYFEKMHNIISVSKKCRDIFVDIFPEEEAKIQVMYNVLPFEMYKNIPADTKGISSKKKYYKILSISRLDPNKGLDLAIDTLEILLSKGFKIKWFVLGDGNYRKELEKLISTKGLQDHFILLGSHVNTAAFIQESDLVVHPSRFEGKSNVVDEAKYLLKPIIATNYNTVQEQLTHEKTGLISDMNYKSLALNIQKMINNNNLQKVFRNNLYKDRYNDKSSLELFYKIIKS